MKKTVKIPLTKDDFKNGKEFKLSEELTAPTYKLEGNFIMIKYYHVERFEFAMSYKDSSDTAFVYILNERVHLTLKFLKK